MRDIWFRGKRLDNKDWVYGYYFSSDEMPKRGEIGHFIKCGLNAEFMVDPSTVGQFTGKRVKSGEVFDGDIGKSIDGIFLVAWSEEKSAFVMHFYDYPNETLYLEEMWDDSEIIGTIHDKPNLLESEGK